MTPLNSTHHDALVPCTRSHALVLMSPESSPDAQYRSDLPAHLTHPVVPAPQVLVDISSTEKMEDIMHSRETGRQLQAVSNLAFPL